VITGRVLAPGTLEAAIELLGADPDARPIAGGTGLFVGAAQGRPLPTTLVRLDGIPGLDHVAVDHAGRIRIGAMARLRAIERSPSLRRWAPGLVAAIESVATGRIRNQATLGGNLALADPAHDPPPMLIALDAMVHVHGPSGERSIPAGRWFVGAGITAALPAELVTGVELPPMSPGSCASYASLVARTRDDYAIAAAAVRVDPSPGGEIADLRVVVGALGPTPQRLTAIEAVLRGQRPSRALVAEGMDLVPELVHPIGDLRAGADYRRAMAAVQVRRALTQALNAAGIGHDAWT